VIRGEMPIEHGDSWFSAKFIEVRRLIIFFFGDNKFCLPAEAG